MSEEDRKVRRVQQAIMQVLRGYKARGINAVEMHVLRLAVERKLSGQGFFPTRDTKNDIYNDFFERMESCDSDLREKLSKLFGELRRMNREAEKVFGEQARRQFGLKSKQN